MPDLAPSSVVKQILDFVPDVCDICSASSLFPLVIYQVVHSLVKFFRYLYIIFMATTVLYCIGIYNLSPIPTRHFCL